MKLNPINNQILYEIHKEYTKEIEELAKDRMKPGAGKRQRDLEDKYVNQIRQRTALGLKDATTIMYAFYYIKYGVNTDVSLKELYVSQKVPNYNQETINSYYNFYKKQQ